LSQSAIAAYLGKDKSTISRELKRNTGLRGYRPKQAQEKASLRQASKPRSKRFTAALRQEVEELLRQDFSPEQIAGRAEYEGREMVSHECIYQHIWSDKRSGGDLYTHLRHAPKKRRKRYACNDRRGQLPNKVSIEERPRQVETRQELGHWEIDTVIGHSHQGAIVTAVERTSRLTVIGCLSGKHADALADRTLEILMPYKAQVHSITSDNGTEFAQHERIAKVLEAAFYFAHPYHSWERGTNENTNGLIRQYFPKSMCLDSLTQADCQKIMDKLNNRPRKVLGFRTPNEVFFSNNLSTVALAT
jgi:transposase, IS30 family